MTYQNTVKFTDDQQAVFNLLVKGEDVFLSGNAGTGKSFVIRQFLDYLTDNNKQYIVCASTGTAASDFEDGTTIHKAFGLPPKDVFDPDAYYNLKDEIIAADVIIIDEVSMCRCDMMDVVLKLVNIARGKRSDHRCQLVLVGDFFQLPPVLKKEDREELEKIYPGVKAGYAFNAKSWEKQGFHTCFLTTIVRQQDKEFIEKLNLLRIGDESCIGYFNTFVRDDYDACTGVRLTARNNDVEETNAKELANIDGEEKVYTGDNVNDYPASRFPFPDELRIKRGARVMSLYNHEGGDFQNGSLGVVEDFTDTTVTVKFDNGKTVEIQPHQWREMEPETVQDESGKEHIVHEERSSYTRIPLRLAYAITIHKSQGQTFDSIVLDPESFDAGQLYVAISRCSSPKGLALTKKIKSKYVKVSEEVLAWYRANEGRQEKQQKERVSDSLQSKQQVAASASAQASGKTGKYTLAGNHPHLAPGGIFGDAFSQIDEAICDAHPNWNRVIRKSYVGYKSKESGYSITLSANEKSMKISLHDSPSSSADPKRLVQQIGDRYVLQVKPGDDLSYALRLVQ